VYTLFGKEVCETLDELVRPDHTAIVVVDVQNDYVSPEGVDAKRDRPLHDRDTLLENLGRLIEQGRERGVLVVYIQNTLLPGRMSDSPARLRSQLRFWQTLDDPEALPQSVIDGSWGQQVVPEIAPQDGDLVVKKHRSSAFIGTDLDMLLRSNGIQTVIATGLATEACVESTARDAAFLDYYVVVPEDCVSSWNVELHDAALTIMRTQFECVASDAILTAWTAAGAVQSAPAAV
jgi:nicotinamidase-related amidase